MIDYNCSLLNIINKQIKLLFFYHHFLSMMNSCLIHIILEYSLNLNGKGPLSNISTLLLCITQLK